MKKHNFYAGPSILSEYTIKNTADAILNLPIPAFQYWKCRTAAKNSPQ